LELSELYVISKNLSISPEYFCLSSGHIAAFLKSLKGLAQMPFSVLSPTSVYSPRPYFLNMALERKLSN
jgi:hypothetical protein